MKILIAIPCMDNVSVYFAESLLNMDKPDGSSVTFQRGSLIYDGRNLISLKAITEQYDYVMWIDSDMILPKDTLPRLLAIAQEKDVPMVSGLYVKRAYPTSPVLYSSIAQPAMNKDGFMIQQIITYEDYPQNSVFPVAGCGFGCVLTSVPLLKKVWDKFGPAFSPYPWAGEDISFCYRVNQLNETILCDSSISCGHIGTLAYTEKMLKRGEQND